MRCFFLVFVVFVGSAVWMPVSACPLCKDALAANADEDVEGINFPAAMNESIYLMLAVPYTTLAVLGFLVYRGVRKNAAFLETLHPSNELEIRST